MRHPVLSGLIGPVLGLLVFSAPVAAQELAFDLASFDGSNVTHLYSAADRLYLSANDGVHSQEPWVYDSETGATMLADLFEGINAGSRPTEFTLVGGHVYFAAYAGNDTGTELWRYDGSNPPVLVADLAPGDACSCPENLTGFQGDLIFTSNIAGPSQLWTVTGSGDPVQPFPNDPSGTSPRDLVVVDDVLYYTAEDDQQNRVLWTFDGQNPPEMLLSGPTWYDVRYPTPFDGQIVFRADNQAWAYDGASEPVKLVSAAFGNEYPKAAHSFTEYDGRLYFSGLEPDTNSELWVWDGSSDPELVADLAPDDASNPYNFVELDGILYFQGLGTVWRYNGQGVPTPLAEPSIAYDTRMVVHDGRIFYVGTGGERGHELWSWNGVDPPMLAADINRSSSSNPAHLLTHDGAIYFSAEAYPEHLMRLDGADVRFIPVDDNSDAKEAPIAPVWFNGAIHFLAKNEGPTGSRVAPRDIYRVSESGDVAEFQARINLSEGSASSFPGELVPGEDGYLYFAGHDGTSGFELWRWDGIGDPAMIADLEPGSESSDPKFFTWFDGAMYFKAETSAHGEALWRYVPGEGAELFHETNIQTRPFVHDGNLFFSHGQIRVYDGENDPLLVATPDDPYPNARTFKAVNGVLYFASYDPGGPAALFSYDGSGPAELVDSGVAFTYIGDLAAIGSALCFQGEVDNNHRQLWCHDTASGTTREYAINPSGNSDPMSFALLDDQLYFAANDGVSGREIWRISKSLATNVQYVGEQPGHRSPAIDVYPNPAVASTIVSFPDEYVHDADIEVFDILGRRTGIFRTLRPGSGAVPAVHLDVSGLSPGVYFVRVRSDGSDVTRPFIRSR